MSRRKYRALRASILAGLSLTLLTGVTSVPRPALADTGSIAIRQHHNQGATYDAYQLFGARISPDDKATRIRWASEDMKATLLAFIDANGYTEWLEKEHPGEGMHDRAQVAAEFVAESICGSPTDVGAATTPRTTEALSFSQGLARALARDTSIEHETVPSQTCFTGEQGLWLFVTTDSTTEAAGEAGSAPMWIPLGGSVSEIDEKSSVPTVDKEVREDSTGRWGKAADADTAQDLSYRLTGTLPTNFGAFDSYHYRFTDKLDPGLCLSVPKGKDVADALTVRVGDHEVAVDGEKLSASLADNVLVVDFTDLKDQAWSTLAIDKDTAITVEYTAHMNDQRAIGSAGNLNSVYLTYTDDPISGGDGHTDEVPVRVFAYRLALTKVDAQTGEPVSGAGFTIRVGDGSSDEGSRGLFVQADGSLASSAHEFATSDDGTFEVLGLDEGTYVLSETTVPEGYVPPAHDITLTVNSELDGQTASLSRLSSSICGTDGEDAESTCVAEVSAVDGNAGSLSVRMTNERWLLMPLTGRVGLGALAWTGVGLMASAAFCLVTRHTLCHRI